MKMKPKHYQALRAIVLQDHRPTEASYLEQGLSAKRYRWDLLWNAPGRRAWFDSGVYDYLDDTHIDTALRRIVQESQA